MTRRALVGVAAATQVLPDRPDLPAAGRFIRSWWYARGEAAEHFRFNRRFFPVAATGRRDTIHHEIDLLEPGPALMVRHR